MVEFLASWQNLRGSTEEPWSYWYRTCPLVSTNSMQHLQTPTIMHFRWQGSIFHFRPSLLWNSRIILLLPDWTNHILGYYLQIAGIRILNVASRFVCLDLCASQCHISRRSILVSPSMCCGLLPYLLVFAVLSRSNGGLITFILLENNPHFVNDMLRSL